MAEARIDIEMTRLLCLKAADLMDKVGNKVAKAEIAMIKVAAPNMACQVIDWAIQLFGGAGYMNEYPIARAWRSARVTRIFGGTNEIMKELIGRGL